MGLFLPSALERFILAITRPWVGPAVLRLGSVPVVCISHNCHVGWLIQSHQPWTCARRCTNIPCLYSLHQHVVHPTHVSVARLSCAWPLQCMGPQNGEPRTFCAAWPRKDAGRPATPSLSVINRLKAAVESRRLLEKLVDRSLSSRLISLKRLVASACASPLLSPSGTAT